MHRVKLTVLALTASLIFVSSSFAESEEPLDKKPQDELAAQRQNESGAKAALAKEGLSEQEYGEILNYYYKNPQPDKLISALKVTLSLEQFLRDTSHSYPLAHLFATVAHSDPVFLKNLISMEENYSGLQKDFLQHIINEAKDFKSPEPNSPAALDYLWTEFFVTGKEEPVKKIISALDFKMPENDPIYKDVDPGLLGAYKEADTALINGAANWSLRSNAKQHDRVYEIIKQEADSATGTTKEKLNQILAEVK